MARELLINAGACETRIALVEDGVLQGYDAVLAIGGGARLGDIVLGRVTRVVAAMQAAFVDIAQERDGFLSLRDAPGPVREGDAIAVTVTREAVGEKGAKLSAKIALAPELEARRKIAKPPTLLQAGPGIVERALARWQADRVLVDDARTAARLKIELARDDLFARHELEEQVAGLARPHVALSCGGWITIEATEGLTAIDVNSGGFAASGGREETARLVNLEAAAEIARQVRLRGIGGLVVADFIQMESGGDAVTAVLKRDLARDAARSEISPMTSLGLVAIARQRAGAPPHAGEPCGHCGGSGVRPAPAQVAMEILRAAERSARAAPGRAITVRAAPEVTGWLAANAPAVRAGLDRRGVGRVDTVAEARRREDFDVGT